MLLVVDVGNTNITFGVFAEQKLEATFRMTTKLQRTSDEYGICIRDLISHNKLNPEKIRDVCFLAKGKDIFTQHFHHRHTAVMIGVPFARPGFRPFGRHFIGDGGQFRVILYTKGIKAF